MNRPPELAPELTEIERRLAGRRPGRRSALLSDAAGRPRGDHELNPEFYDRKRPLTPAAVLVPIVARPERPTLLLTRRTDHLADHAGQIAFPGGRLDPCDDSPLACALRETEEEIGLSRQHVRAIGELDLYLTRTGFAVTPVVALVQPPFLLKPDDFEVAEIFEVPLAFILAPESRQVHSREWQGVARQFYAYPYDRFYIWGATAGMLNNLAEVIAPGSGSRP